MNPNLERLIELQKQDTVIAELDSEVKSFPQRKARIESQLTEHIQRVESDKNSLAENQRSRRKREGDIAGFREKISKLKDQTLAVKTNEQYKALLHEVQFIEEEIKKVEDQILAEMVESEAIDKRLKESEQNLKAEQVAAKQEIAVAEKRKEENEKSLAELRATRSEIQKALPPDLYFTYERVAGFRKTMAVAPVRDGTCAGCHVMLRPQAFNEVKTNQQIIYCESCGRMLYYVPEPAAAT